MERHTLYGYELLRAANADPLAQNIALCHHERFNGSGYPRGLAGSDIPMEAQIVALADVYDALRTRRCYKDEFSVTESVDLIEAERGKHFSPELIEAFHASFGKIRAVRRRFKDDPTVAQIERIQALNPTPHK
jgi:putative two-component system response regulator